MKGSKGNSLLSERGSVGIDERTNTLLVQDVAERIAEIRRLVGYPGHPRPPGADRVAHRHRS